MSISNSYRRRGRMGGRGRHGRFRPALPTLPAASEYGWGRGGRIAQPAPAPPSYRALRRSPARVAQGLARPSRAAQRAGSPALPRRAAQQLIKPSCTRPAPPRAVSAGGRQLGTRRGGGPARGPPWPHGAPRAHACRARRVRATMANLHSPRHERRICYWKSGRGAPFLSVRK